MGKESDGDRLGTSEASDQFETVPDLRPLRRQGMAGDKGDPHAERQHRPGLSREAPNLPTAPERVGAIKDQDDLRRTRTGTPVLSDPYTDIYQKFELIKKLALTPRSPPRRGRNAVRLFTRCLSRLQSAPTCSLLPKRYDHPTRSY